MKKRTSAALRKQKERAALRARGMTKVEFWITPETKTLLTAFSARTRSTLKHTAELVMARATPLYLREVQRRLDEAVPLVRRILELERYGVKPAKNGSPPVRIHSGANAIILDPQELYMLLEKAGPLLSQLARYGIDHSQIKALAESKVMSSKRGRSMQRPA